MKILFVSDIHGSSYGAKKIIDLEKKYNFKKVILLGDVGYSGARNVPPSDYYPIDVYKFLNEINDKLVVIRGNCDSRVDEFVLNKKFYDKKILNINGYRFVLTHGDLYMDDDFDLKENDIFCYGHTHVYQLEKKNGYFIINPGSITLPKVNKEKTYIILDFDKKIFKLYDIEDNELSKLSL